MPKRNYPMASGSIVPTRYRVAPIEVPPIALDSTAANLRHHFQRVVRTSPQAYRRVFHDREASGGRRETDHPSLRLPSLSQ